MWDLLCDLEAETVLNLLTDWHGLQLLDDGFYDHLINEGYIDEPEPEIEEEYDEEEFEDFCAKYTACKGCPFEVVYRGECEDLFAEKQREKVAEVEL